MKQIFWLTGCLGILTVIALIVVGHTWQLIPLYTCLGFGLLQLWLNPLLKRRVVVYLVMFVLLSFTVACLYVLPVFTMPAPSGTYKIGVRYAKIQTQRSEEFTSQVDDYRELYTKVWYPSSNVQGYTMNTYIEGGEENIKLLAKLARLPAIFFNHLPSIKTHGYTNAPIAQGQFPVLTFSHGYGSWFGQNTALMEELASHGFIVVSIAHSYQTLFAASDEHTSIRFPRIVPLHEERSKTSENVKYENFIQTKDTATYTTLFYEQIANEPTTNHYASIWAHDIQSAIDFIFEENTDAKSFFYKHIDTINIGSFGMSFGGAASGEVALQDRRIKAALNMDGTQFGNWVNDTMKVPFAFLEAQRSPYIYSMYAPLRGRTKRDYYTLIFQEAKHYNFTDVNLFSPAFQWIGILGSVNGELMIQSMNRIVPDFFDSVFSGVPFQEDKYVRQGVILKPTF